MTGGLRCWAVAFAAVLAPSAAGATAEAIVEARYAAPVERYGHYALGRPHEYSRLEAVTDAGRRLALELPGDEVFEDLRPRLVRLEKDAPPEILAIVSRRGAGSRLALFRLERGGLAAGAQSPAIGTANRWLNPVGVADLDGDGRMEIAAVITPHIGGTLKIYRLRGSALSETAALGGFSNHVYGTAELALSAPFAAAGGMRLLVPDSSRRSLRVIAMARGGLVELGRCALPAAVTGAIRDEGRGSLSVGLASGARIAVPEECRR